VELSITDFEFSPEFNRAIEQKQTAEQLALKAKRDLDRIKVEAQQKIAIAQAEAEALRIQRQAVSPELVRLREVEAQMKAIEKWDGKLPNVTGGAVPFISIGEGRTR
jgi:regulator of protease activity HflC (stomatin/prohibitin superfamily)